MLRTHVFRALLVAAASAHAAGQPIVVECHWRLSRSVSLSRVMGIAYNPLDDSVYVGRRSSPADGLYRIGPAGDATFIVTFDRPSSVCVDPLDGDTFVSEDFGGNIYRVAFGANTRQTWVSGFRAGDDDPTGIVIVPATYTGSVVPPRTAISADRGFSGGFDDVWKWSPDTSENEAFLHTDDGTLLDAIDIAVNDERIIVVDDRGNPGALWEIVDSGGTLVQIVTSSPLNAPQSAVFDADGDLLVACRDGSSSKIVRLRFEDGLGHVSDAIRGFSDLAWDSLELTPDGQRLWAADYDAGVVHEFIRVGPCKPDFNDDCTVNTLDVLAFLNAYNQSDPKADFNGDTSINSLDVLAFLNAWIAGC
ncbi:MAG: hypothetical protein KIS87_06160 [Phycisphaeraceae bacterium]|nr:hypothetical protein [Phycisphaeraceae bacterium]